MNSYFSFITSFIGSLKRILKLKSHDESTDSGASDERYRRILLTAGSSLIVKVISVAINLVTVPLTLNYLGAERYGLWMAISSIMALMGFADLGLGNGLLNAVARAKGLDDKVSAKIAVSSTFYILVFISLILLIFFLSIYPFISWFNVFNVKSAIAKQEAGVTVIALVIPLLINMPLGIVQRIQEGSQEGYRFQLFQILGSIFSFFSLLGCVYFKVGLPGLVLAFSAGPILATIINGIAIFRKRYNYLIPKITFFKLKDSKALFSSGIVFFILNIFSLFANASDNIIIAHVLGASSVAAYEIVKKIFLFSMVTQFVIQPLWPAFNEALAKGDMVWVRKTLRRALKLSIGFGAIATLPLLLFGRQIISYWVGNAYLPSWLLLTGFYVFVFQANYGGVMSTFLNSGHFIKKQTIFIALAAISSIILKIILAKYFGVAGVIWATILGYSIFYVYPSYKLAHNYLNNKLNA